jgi:membrane dipeptidase
LIVMEMKPKLTRRQMLAGMTAACGATLLGRSILPDAVWAQETVDPRVAKIVADTITVDMHNHVSQPPFAKTPADRKPDPAGVDLPGQMKKAGLATVCLTYAVDSYRSPQPGDWYRYHLQILAYIDRLLARSGMHRALTMADLEAAHRRKTPIVIQDCEGAQWIEGHIERVEEAYKRGLRHLQLVHQMHDLAAPLAGVQQLVEPAGGVRNSKSAGITGLTAFGADVIRECNRLGIVVDMAHGTEAAVLGALKVARQPLVVSHTALDTPISRTANNYKGDPGLVARLVSKNYAKAVADADGIMGVWHIFPTMKDFVTAIKQMVDVAGVDHTGIGTDTAIAPAAWGRGGAPAARGRSEALAARAGGRRGRGTLSFGTNGIWPDEKGGFMYAVAGEMLAQGFRPDEIAKIAGANYGRIFEKVTSAQA